MNKKFYVPPVERGLLTPAEVLAERLSVLIGAVGEAKSDVHHEGSVQVNKELWTARSEELIEAGSQIRVVGREGFVLVVEKN